MDEITGVVSDADTSPLDFRVTSGGGSSSEGFNIVTVGLEGAEGDSNVSVIAARVIPEFPASMILLAALGVIVTALTIGGRFGLGRVPGAAQP